MTSFSISGSLELVELNDPTVYVVGFSGRDERAVRRHIAELERAGVSAPTEIPSVWEFDDGILTQGDAITGRRGATSGEAEPVLVFADGSILVSVGSDHTDRELERQSIEDAKRACQKVVARTCWPIERVRARWDKLHLESEARRNGSWLRYQDAPLRELLPLDWFLDRFAGERSAVVFCGTVPTLNGIDTNATGFRAALIDQVPSDVLRCEYGVEERDG